MGRFEIARHDILTKHALVQKAIGLFAFFTNDVLILHNSHAKRSISLPAQQSSISSDQPAKSRSFIFFTRTVRSMHIFAYYSSRNSPGLVFVMES